MITLNKLLFVAVIIFFVLLQPCVRQLWGETPPGTASEKAQQESAGDKGATGPNPVSNVDLNSDKSAQVETTKVEGAEGNAPEAVSEKEAELKSLDKPIKIIPYLYNSEARRDPFMTVAEFNKLRRALLEGKKRHRILSPLEMKDTSQMLLVGVVIDETSRYASVVLPDGKAYIVQVGAYIGLNGGKVDEIAEDKIIVKEVTFDTYGKAYTKLIPICIIKEEGQECK